MAKNKKNKEDELMLLASDIDVIGLQTKHRKKSGGFKGTKNEKKTLKCGCVHAVYQGKNKKVKRTVHPDRKRGEVICENCGRAIPTSFYSNQDINKAFNKTDTIISQAAFMQTSMGASKKTVNLTSNLLLMNDKARKTAIRTKNVAEKQEKMKKKKKNNKNKMEYGTWGRK